MLVIHRIIDIQGDTVLLQGDANNAVDNPISISAIKGKMALAIPLLGGLIRFIKSAPITLFIIVLAFFLIEESWKKQKRSEQSRVEEIQDEIQRLRQELESDSNATTESSLESPPTPEDKTKH